MVTAAVTLAWPLVGAVVAERVVELVVSARNARALLARGGYEVGASHYPFMVVLHAGLLVGCAVEPLIAGRAVPPLARVFVVAVALAMALRWWAVVTLGERWTTRVVVLPGAPRVTAGPYRILPHPNYLAVVVEGLALPAACAAWGTATVFAVANLALLAVRIRAEERALDEAAPVSASRPTRTVEVGA